MIQVGRVDGLADLACYWWLSVRLLWLGGFIASLQDPGPVSRTQLKIESSIVDLAWLTWLLGLGTQMGHKQEGRGTNGVQI